MAAGEEAGLVGQVLVDLAGRDDVDRRVGEREVGEVGADDVRRRVGPRGVRRRVDVDLDADDPAGGGGQHVGAVALAAARLQHVGADDERPPPAVDDQVPAEPVVLVRRARQRPLPRQRQPAGLRGGGDGGHGGRRCHTVPDVRTLTSAQPVGVVTRR